MRKLEKGVLLATRNALAEEINFAKGASRTGKNFGKVCTAKAMCWGCLENSEGNGGIRKE